VTWADGFIAIDWGSTNRRGYRIDSRGAVIAQTRDANGVLAIADRDFVASLAQFTAPLGPAPMLLAGMIGSNRGWANVPYCPTPADASGLAGAVHWLTSDVAIVPGVSTRARGRADVMRGEEVQAIGAIAAGLAPPDGVTCHPGTHTKWATLTGGRIADLTTAMTGEVFALLRTHSILASQLGGKAEPGPAFAAGVEAARCGEPLLDALFSIRSTPLVLADTQTDWTSYASGLLIGADVCARPVSAGTIVVLGDAELCALYAAALAQTGIQARIVSDDAAFVAGMVAIAARLTR